MQRLLKIVLWLVGTLLVVGLITAVFGYVSWSLAPHDPSQTETALKAFLDNGGYNLLGDTLSGLFAPITFLIVVCSLLLQDRQMRQAVDDMRTQTGLNKQIAQANYKLALHEKRLAVYGKLRDCAFDVVMHGTVTKETRLAINAALQDAKFVFGNEVLDYIQSLTIKSHEHMKANALTSRLNGKRDRVGNLTETEHEQWEKAVDIEHSLEQWFYDNLTDEIIDDKLAPHLILPVAIA